MEPSHTTNRTHDEIELAAYYLWQERGSPLGSPEVDWFRAERQLREHFEEASQDPLVAVAKAVGAAVGSLTGLVESVTSLIRPADKDPSS